MDQARKWCTLLLLKYIGRNLVMWLHIAAREAGKYSPDVCPNQERGSFGGQRMFPS